MPIRSLIKALASDSDVSVVVTDGALAPAGPRILYVNPAFERMTGYAAEDVIGRTPRLLQGPATSLAARKRLSRSLRSGQTCRVTLVNYRKNGERYRCAIELFPITAPNGELIYAVALEVEVKARPGPRASHD